MADAEFSFDGFDPHDLADKLEALQNAITDRLEEALEQWVLIVEATAKRLVPVDTGRLRSSISSEVRHEGEAIIAGHIGSNTEYAGYVESGTSEQNAQPYLRPSIETHRSDLIRLVEDALDRAKADVA